MYSWLLLQLSSKEEHLRVGSVLRNLLHPWDTIGDPAHMFCWGRLASGEEAKEQT
jgi:hypothetical protein